MVVVSWITAFWWAITLVVLEALIIAALLTIMKGRDQGFGRYAESMDVMHEDNLVIHSENMLVRQDNLRIFDELEACRAALIDANRQSQLLQRSNSYLSTQILTYVKQEKRA